jgi:hypothetical protein
MVFIAQAQPKLSRSDVSFLKAGYAGMYNGVSIPVASFAATDRTSDQSGYAKAGYQFGFDIGYELFQWLGFRLSYIDIRNGLNANELRNAYNQGNSFNRFVGGNSRVDAVANTSYSMRGIMIGAFYPMHMANTTITLGAQAGYTNTIDPELRMAVVNLDSNMLYSFFSPEFIINEPAYQFSMDVRTRLYNSIQIFAGVNYLFLTSDVQNRLLYRVPPGPIGVFNYTLNYQVVNLRIGLVFGFE